LNIFDGKNILIIGARSSAADLARELSQVAAGIFVSDRTLEDSKNSTFFTNRNINHLPKIKKILDDGTFLFGDNLQWSLPKVDIVIYCTEYEYSFPFMKTSHCRIENCPDSYAADEFCNIEESAPIVQLINGRAVVNTYQHVFLNDNPTMAFVGLPWSVTPFHLFYLQAKWISSVYREENPVKLPSKSSRSSWIHARINDLMSAGCNKFNFPDKFHYLGDEQWEYFRFLARSSNIFDEFEDLYLRTNEQIYNDNKDNFPKYPGAPDLYRNRNYVVDRDSGSWTVH
jgi:hypothetical protein